MKKVFCIAFLAFLLFVNIGLSQEIPTLQKYVNDFANVLSSSDEARINVLCAEIEENWTVEIAVLTVQTTEPMSIEEYAVETFEKNGIGQKDVDNGLLIIAAIQDRKWRFEVGYGLEPIINDAKAGRVGTNYLVPYFREEKYGDGFYYAVDAIGKLIQSGGDESIISEGVLTEDEIVYIVFMIIIAIIVFLPIIFILISRFAVERCPKCGTRMKCRHEDDYLICECPKCGKKIKKKKKKGIPWIFFVGGFGGHGGGGGGGGFGGGGSGGGGASGGW